MLKVETAITVRAPVTTVRDLYADYAGWPALFPTIKGVRLVDQRGSSAVLDIDHVEGHVINELTVSGNEIRLWEVSSTRSSGNGRLDSIKALRRLPVTFGWLQPLGSNAAVRRDLRS